MDKIFEDQTISKKTKKKSSLGLFWGGLTGTAAVLISVLSFPFILPAFRKICLPYIPATDEQIINIIKALKGRSGNLIDLGSGDGRIVLNVVKTKNIKATGVELNPCLVWYSRICSWRKGLSAKTTFVQKNLWKTDLSPYQNVVIIGVQPMMDQLERKLAAELNESSLVIASRFPLPSWKPTATIGDGLDQVWVYSKQS